MRRRVRYLLLVVLLATASQFIHAQQSDEIATPIVTVQLSRYSDARWRDDSQEFWTWQTEFMSDPEQNRGVLYRWSAQTGERLTEIIYDHPDNIGMKLDWSAGENRVLVAGGNNVEVWDAVSGEKRYVYEHPVWIDDARWDADFQYILSRSYQDDTVQIHDPDSGALIRIFDAGEGNRLINALWDQNAQRIMIVLTTDA
jgi:WD40 repeat protein